MIKKNLFLIILALPFHVISQNIQEIKVGQNAPDTLYKLIDKNTGEHIETKGKVILVNFFAIWCSPCVAELPVLQARVWNKYKNNSDFALLVFGRGHSINEINAFKIKNKFDMPMSSDLGLKMFRLFAYQSIPRNYVIDKNGIIVYASKGFNLDEFKRMQVVIDNLLKE